MAEGSKKARTGASCMHTGGAAGADALWARAAFRGAAGTGLTCRVFSFAGHYISDSTFRAPSQHVRVEQCTARDLDSVSLDVFNVAKRLGKRCPGGMAYKLIARNALSVKDVEAVFAVGRFVSFPPPAFIITALDVNSLGVDGGTGWTCEFYVDARRRADAPPYLFFFDVDHPETGWWQLQGGEDKKDFVWWEQVQTPPNPIETFERWAGIGSRELDEKVAQEVMNRLFTIAR